MLELLNIDSSVRQGLLLGQKANRIFRAITSLDHVWADPTESQVLVFYGRSHSCGMAEVGIYYGPGPGCKGCEEFPSEILRLFSVNSEDLISMGDYYFELVKQEDFHRIKFSKDD